MNNTFQRDAVLFAILCCPVCSLVYDENQFLGFPVSGGFSSEIDKADQLAGHLIRNARALEHSIDTGIDAAALQPRLKSLPLPTELAQAATTLKSLVRSEHAFIDPVRSLSSLHKNKHRLQAGSLEEQVRMAMELERDLWRSNKQAHDEIFEGIPKLYAFISESAMFKTFANIANQGGRQEHTGHSSLANEFSDLLSNTSLAVALFGAGDTSIMGNTSNITRANNAPSSNSSGILDDYGYRANYLRIALHCGVGFKPNAKWGWSIQFTVGFKNHFYYGGQNNDGKFMSSVQWGKSKLVVRVSLYYKFDDGVLLGGQFQIDLAKGIKTPNAPIKQYALTLRVSIPTKKGTDVHDHTDFSATPGKIVASQIGPGFEWQIKKGESGKCTKPYVDFPCAIDYDSGKTGVHTSFVPRIGSFLENKGVYAMEKTSLLTINIIKFMLFAKARFDKFDKIFDKFDLRTRIFWDNGKPPQ